VLFSRLAADGGATAVVHLAAHYDFTGERHPDYQRTNVDGTRRLLDACAGLGLERFVFASSLAACEFPRAGKMLVESSPPDGTHVYAESKRAGEELMRRESRFPTAIVRFAALYSDWCEYAPLYSLLRTWLARSWNSRILGGRGSSAVPYLHVGDASTFLERLLEMRSELEPAEVLIASSNRVTSHADLFRAVTTYVRGNPLRPILHPAAGRRAGAAPPRRRGQGDRRAAVRTPVDGEDDRPPPGGRSQPYLRALSAGRRARASRSRDGFRS
jgi:nucleoside-diphosphate-sugar epimerase